MQSTYPKGLLSFLYNVLYDRQVNNEFHADQKQTMDFFGLSEQAQQAIVAFDRSQLDDLLNELKTELEADRAEVW